jgi:hypothetical protein
MSSFLTAIIDADMIKYGASFAGQKSSISVTHPTLNISVVFGTRTDFYGHYAKKAGGWLAEYNKGRESIILPSEFTIEDIVVAEPIQNVLHTTRLMYEAMYTCIGTKRHKGFIGKGDSFRLERSTLLKYKDRPAPKPIHIDAVTDYLEHRLKCEVVTYEETDERVTQECYRQPNNVAVGEDKDYYGQPNRFFNVNKPDEGIIDCDCFGKLWLQEKVNSKGKVETDVRGYGRMWLYYQTLNGDSVDNFKANCFSEMSWGDKSAYKKLEGSINDKDALSRMVEAYKVLYPEPKVITGWRGDTFETDWLYVMQECFTMARMRRVKGEPEVILKDVLKKLEIKID